MIAVYQKLTRLGDQLSRREVTPEQAAPTLLHVLSDLVDTPVTALFLSGSQMYVHVRVSLETPVARLLTEVRTILEQRIGRRLASRAILEVEEGSAAIQHVAHWVVEPLVIPDQPLGFLLAGGERPFSEEIAAVVKLLAVQASTAMTNGLLYRNLALERDRANLLLEATVAFNRAVEQTELRRVALDHLSRDLRMPQGMWLTGRDYRISQVIGLLPVRAESLKGARLDARLVPWVLDLGMDAEPVDWNSQSSEDRRSWEKTVGFLPLLAVPIPLEGEREIVLLGDLARPDYRPSQEDALLAKTLAGIAASVLRRDFLMEELKAARLDAIKALASAVDAKDHYTHSHSGNVSRLAEAIARHMGLPREQRELARLGGLLHDLGKIGVPESLLNKQSQLDPAEYLRVKQHPLIGERIAASIHGLDEVARIIRAHHEQYDGGGYPDQLKGEQIPLPARIISVADSFDAMTSDRPYRKGLPLTTAMQRLQEGNGHQFDPKVVEALTDYLAQRAQRAA